jgi:hypothetical protein
LGHYSRAGKETVTYSAPDIFVPEHSEAAVPRHLRISEGMVEDLLYDPVMAIWIFFGVEMDAFQEVRTKLIWFGQDVDDRSGFSSGKTVTAWWLLNLAGILKPDHRAMVVYPTFQQGKETFWEYYDRFSTPLFRAQLGRVEMDSSDEDGDGTERKSNLRGSGMWTQYFRNKSQVKMPAPNFGKKATTLSSIRLNWLWLEEANKILGTDGGFSGATKQLLGRVTRQSFNKEHPVWGNRVTYSSTAELANHPAEAIHKKIEKRAEQGSPRHASFAFCYKDFSNLPAGTGKSFRDEYRDQAGVDRVLEVNSEEAGAAEVYGFSSLQGEEWFDPAVLEAMEALGEKRDLAPVISRASDDIARPIDVERVSYFCGVDPAPAKGPKNDFGAVVVMRSILLPGMGGENEADYQLDFIYARKVKRFRAAQWSGLIHEKHADFGFGRICLDLGGGGDWIVPELREDKQLIGGTPVERKPIVEIGFPLITGDPILVTLRRKDFDLLRVFPELKHAQGDDKMKDWCNTAFQTAVGKGLLAIPKKFGKWSAEERQQWSIERKWAAQNLGLIPEHMGNVAVEKNADGSFKMTAHGAKVFAKRGRDDFHDGARNAYLAFRCWLTTRVNGLMGAGLANGGVECWD